MNKECPHKAKRVEAIEIVVTLRNGVFFIYQKIANFW